MKIAFTNCSLLDGSEDMRVQENMTVIVEDGRITAIDKGGQAPKGFCIVDLHHRYLMPGLINLHVHLPGSGAPKKKQQDSVKMAQLVLKNAFTRKIGMKLCESYARTELMSGVTTIRTVGGLGDFDGLIRNKINEERLLGPRILSSDTAISVEGGHMTGSVSKAAHSDKECREMVRRLAEQRVDWIKIMVTGGVLDAKVKGEPGELKMKPEFIKACCEEAHRLGLKVAAHIESTEGVRTALENGVDTVEHGAKVDDSIIELFKKNNASHICTISPALPLTYFGDDVMHSTDTIRFNSRVVLDGVIDCAKKCIENNIPVGLGTDTACPFVTHYDMWREVVYFQKYVGVSPAFALYTATKRNAEIAGLGNETGSIDIGKSADFLIVDRNPLEDMTALRMPYMVVMKGRIIENPKVKKIKVCEEELDKHISSL